MSRNVETAACVLGGLFFVGGLIAVVDAIRDGLDNYKFIRSQPKT